MKTMVFTADRQHHEGAKQKFEIQRLERCESAWTAVFDLIVAKNRESIPCRYRARNASCSKSTVCITSQA